METKKLKKRHIVIIVIAALILILCAGLLVLHHNFVKSVAHSQTLPDNTVINGVDCSGLAKSGVVQKIADTWDSESFVLETGGTRKAGFPLRGTTYTLAGDIDKTLSGVNVFSYVGHFFGKPYELQVKMAVKDTGTEFNSSFEHFVNGNGQNVIESKDAYVDMSNKEFNVIPEVYGNQIQRDKLLDDIYDHISDASLTMEYNEKEYFDKPGITKDSPEIAERLEYCKKYLSFDITYEFGETKYTMTPTEMDEIIYVNEDGKVRTNKEKAAQFVLHLAGKYNTFGMSRTIKTTLQGTKTITGGTYGYVIDKDAELKQLRKDLRTGKDVSREPVYSMRGRWRNGTNDMTDTYVEVDITNQRMWYYKNGKLIITTPVVTGDISKHRGTATGTYGIAYKAMNRTLTGGDAPVDVEYWIPFNGGQGFHDAWWRKSFGGSIYISDGSHGCVNMPPKAAGIFYRNVSAGDMVYSYY